MTDITDLVSKEAQIESIRRELRGEDRSYGMIGASPAMQKVFDLITNAAQSDAPVIIFGESGTGNELVAKAIHFPTASDEKRQIHPQHQQGHPGYADEIRLAREHPGTQERV